MPLGSINFELSNCLGQEHHATWLVTWFPNYDGQAFLGFWV